jgi:hypothetical protein
MDFRHGGFSVFSHRGIHGKETARPEARPQPWRTFSDHFITPPLVWALLTQNRYFRPLMLASAVLVVGMEFWIYSQSTGELKAVFEVVGGVLSEAMMTVYLLMKVRPHKV